MGKNILAHTMMEMRWMEVEAYAKLNATVLLPIGVVEEHGPHLCLGTDIYLSTDLAQRICDEMQKENHLAIVAPPFYWGIISGVNATFSGSFTCKPETLKAVLYDLVNSLKTAGFKNIVGINAHGDKIHCQTIIEAFKEIRESLKVNVYWQTFEDDLEKEGLNGTEEYILAVAPYLELFDEKEDVKDIFDVHAGAHETALMKESFPELVDLELAEKLGPTNLDKSKRKRWQEGGELERRITPYGYCGNPSAYKACPSNVNPFAVHIARGIIERLTK